MELSIKELRIVYNALIIARDTHTIAYASNQLKARVSGRARLEEQCVHIDALDDLEKLIKNVETKLNREEQKYENS